MRYSATSLVTSPLNWLLFLRARYSKRSIAFPKKLKSRLFPWELMVQGQVQLEHVDTRLAEEAQIRPFGELGD